LPIYPKSSLYEENISEKKEGEEWKQPKVITKTVILPDGSYGTQTIILDDEKSKSLLINQDECSYL